jgi:hypothetical protein
MLLVRFSFCMDCHDHRALEAGRSAADTLSSPTLLRETPEQLRKKPRQQPTNQT